MKSRKKSYRNSEEWALVRRCQEGDRDAFDELFGRYQQKVYNSVFHFLGNETESYDVCQEVFIRLFKSIKSFRGESSFFTWLYRIVINASSTRFKQYTRQRRLMVQPLEFEAKPLEKYQEGSSNTEREIQSKETVRLVQRELMQLDPEHKRILVLREIDNLSYEEIGKILKIRAGTVKSKIARGRALLRDRLAPYLS